MDYNFLRPFLRTPVSKPFIKRFVAGETIGEGLAKAKELTQSGYGTILSYLGGEHVIRVTDIIDIFDKHDHLLSSVYNKALGCDVAVKLSSFGLFSAEWGIHKFEDFVSHALEEDVFVWIDAEELEFRKETFEIAQGLSRYKNLGLCVQAYAIDSWKFFVKKVFTMDMSVRICKGAYKKKDRKKIIKNEGELRGQFLSLLQCCIKGRMPRIQIATHDQKLIYDVLELADYYQAKDRIEFAFLLGRHESPIVRELMEQGFRILVYVPFGPMWEYFIIRRIQEDSSCFFLPFKR